MLCVTRSARLERRSNWRNSVIRRALGDVFPIFALQRAVLETESAVLALQRARIDARVDLHLALGGGFDDPPPSRPTQDP